MGRIDLWLVAQSDRWAFWVRNAPIWLISKSPDFRFRTGWALTNRGGKSTFPIQHRPHSLRSSLCLLCFGAIRSLYSLGQFRMYVPAWSCHEPGKCRCLVATRSFPAHPPTCPMRIRRSRDASATSTHFSPLFWLAIKGTRPDTILHGYVFTNLWGRLRRN